MDNKSPKILQVFYNLKQYIHIAYGKASAHRIVKMKAHKYRILKNCNKKRVY